MRSPHKPVWSEGMLLSPQHLQTLDRAHEALVAARVGAIAPVDWGVVDLEVDEAALAAGEFRVLRFAGVFQDGLPLAFEGPERAPAPRPAGARLSPAARVLEVFLAVPREREGVPGYADDAVPSVNAASRYLAAARPVEDATAPGMTAEVRLARPNAVLLFGDERREDHEAIKVAEVTRAPNGQPALDRTYVPPCLRIGASPWILGQLRDLQALLIAKYRELAGTQRHREAASEMTALDVRRLLQLLILGTHIPEIAHLADAGDASPRDCYRALGQLAGQLCTFRGDDPSAAPKFSHLDLRATLEPLFAAIAERLGVVGTRSYIAVPLVQKPGGLHEAIVDDQIAAAQLFLAVASDVPEGRIAEQVPELCKLSSSGQLVDLMRGALPGLRLQLVIRPPPQLPVKPGAVFFSLAKGGPYWQRILAEKNLALFLPPPFDPERTRLELFAVPSEGGK